LSYSGGYLAFSINLNYWGCNQYITITTCSQADLQTARTGILFVGFLKKLLMPLIVMLPGIAAFVLRAKDGHLIPNW
jgi:SSS family solute:Na+ symporter